MIVAPAVEASYKLFRSAGTLPTDSRIIPQQKVLSFSIKRRPTSCLEQLQQLPQLYAARQW